jgi:hypothetical protein
MVKTMKNLSIQSLILIIALTGAIPVLAMHNQKQVIPLVAIEIAASPDSIIKLPEPHKDWPFDTNDIESIDADAFKVEIQEQHNNGHDYKFALVTTTDNQTPCYPYHAKNINRVLITDPRLALESSLLKRNPMTLEFMHKVEYFTIPKGTKECTHICSYNDFVTNIKSREQWNTLFPENQIAVNVTRERDPENNLLLPIGNHTLVNRCLGLSYRYRRNILGASCVIGALTLLGFSCAALAEHQAL